MVLRTLYRNGNALIVGIPPKYAAALNLAAGAQVSVTLENRRLIVQRAIITGEGDLCEAGAREETTRE
ncbi:MAG: hypothetical protein LAO77_23110 [Acidobacteriia bacterium]|nr:hypothetical protein [Terriglobia bacterium]